MAKIVISTDFGFAAEFGSNPEILDQEAARYQVLQKAQEALALEQSNYLGSSAEAAEGGRQDE